MMNEKPALPDNLFDPFPRIPVDEASSEDFNEILRIADFAAGAWVSGPHGPYANPDMTGAQSTRGQLREALLQLLELGVIDIDSGRLDAVLRHGVPISREPEEAARPAGPNTVLVNPANVYVGDGKDGWRHIGTTEGGVTWTSPSS